MPPPPPKSKPPLHLLSSSSTSSSRPQAFSNPVYPFFTPQRQPSSLHGNGLGANRNAVTSKMDDDVELLRQYGLDKFNLNDNNPIHHNKINGKTGNSQFYTASMNGSAINSKFQTVGDTANSNGRGNNTWAKFD